MLEDILPYSLHTLVINYLYPEDVVLLKTLIRIQEFSRYFEQDIKYIKIFNCKQKISSLLENNLEKHDITFIEFYLDCIICVGLDPELHYNYKQQTIIPDNININIENFKFNNDFLLKKFNNEIFTEAYIQFIKEKLRPGNIIVLPNIKTLNIYNEIQCHPKDKHLKREKRDLLRKNKLRYSVTNNKKITVFDLLNGIWKVKIFKTVDWYMHYNDCKVKIENDTLYLKVYFR